MKFHREDLFRKTKEDQVLVDLGSEDPDRSGDEKIGHASFGSFALHGSDSLLNPPTSPSLVLGLKEGDQQAWSRFFYRYGPIIYSRCRARGLGPEDASDVFQTVLIKVHKSIRRYKPAKASASFRSWLRRITANVITDVFRASQNQPYLIDTENLLQELRDLSGEVLEETTDQTAQINPINDAVVAVSSEFEFRTWQAFWRMTVDEQPAKQVADELEMSEGAARQAKYAVKKRLKEKLQSRVTLVEAPSG